MRRGRITLLATWALLGAAGCVNEYLHGEGADEGASGGGATSGSATGEADATNPDSGAQSGSGDGEGTSGAPTSSTGFSSTVTTMDPSSGSDVDPSAGDASDGDPSGGDASGGDASGGDTGSLELCEGPCESNAMCGADGDRCVELTEGVTACLRSCGRGCPEGLTCTMRTDVEGGSSEQCVPDGNVCP